MPADIPNLPVPTTPAEQKQQEALVRLRFWRKTKQLAGRIPFSSDLLAAYYCAIDPATPRKVRVILMAALAYFVVPTDLIPDFIAGLGYTDDATVLLAALGSVRQHIAPRHKEQAERTLSELAGN